MIASQRKAHKLIWLGMVIVVPVLLFFAVKNLEFTSLGEETKNKLQIEVELVKDKPNRHVRVKLNKAFANSSSVIYEIDSEGELGKVLGQLHGKGEYKFYLSQTATGISIVDKIKNKNSYTTTF